MSSLPLITEITVNIIIARVVVLIPPAVDPGDPPINIYIIVITFPDPDIAVVEILLNPAVLGVTAEKYELTSLSPKLILDIVPGLLHSATKKSTVPITIKETDIVITTLE